MGSLYLWAAEASLEELVQAAQADTSNDTVAMGEIVRRFEPKALSLASFVTKDYHLQQDVANAARLGVVTAVRAHTAGTPGVAAYVAMTMRGEAYRAIGRNTEKGATVNPVDSPVWISDRNHVVEESVVDSDLGLLAQDLSIEQRSLVFARYVIGDSLGDIATEAGTSVSAISQRFKTIHKSVGTTAMACSIPAA
jgi:DNA-directed RNA polymerase specialized sigma24 family protein